MIRNFANAATARIWNGIAAHNLDGDLLRRAFQRLRMLDIESEIDGLVPLGLTILKAPRRGQFAIPIAHSYWICFRWCDGECSDVEVVDFDVEEGLR